MKTGIRVWLVDDDDDFRELFSEMLGMEKVIGSVKSFCSAGELLSALREPPGPDVILMDVQMPEISGIEAIPLVHHLAPNARVLMVTTFFDETSRRQSFAAGASGYFCKNISSVRIIDAMHSAIRQPFEVPDQEVTKPDVDCHWQSP